MALATAATGISAAANLPEACEYDKLSSNLHNDADRKTGRADELKIEKVDLMEQRSVLQGELAAILSKTGNF